MKSIGFPDPFAAKDVKLTKEYGLAFLRAMYNEWNGSGERDYQYRATRIDTARSHAGGYQDSGQYQDIISPSGDLTYMNLDFSIVPIIPKFVDILVNSITNYDFSVNARAIDPISVDKRKQKEMELKIKMRAKDFLIKLEAASGMPIISNDEFIPNSIDEIELFMQIGYKMAAEIAIEQGLDLAMSINDWRELSKRVVRDLVVIGIGVVKTEVGEHGVIIRYVDPKYFVTSYSDSPDFKNITWAGEIRRIRIGELKSEAGDQFSEKEYQDMATRFSGKFNNPMQFSLEPISENTHEGYEYDQFLIDILDGQFILPDVLKIEKKYTKYGNYTVNKKKDTYKPSGDNKYKREIHSTSYECKYSGTMIIGTEYIYDYDMAPNQIRAKSNLSKTYLDYIAYSPDLNMMQNKSICERMITHGNQIQLINLKMQHLVAKARPKGLALEVGSLEGVQDGKGGMFKPLDLQDIYDQTGTMYYRLLNDEGVPINTKPITELEGGVGSTMTELINQYNFNLQMIRDVSGINEARDGSLPDKEAVVGAAKLNLIASNTATRSIHDAYLNIYKRTAESAVLMIQDLVEYDKPYRGYINAIGQTNMDIIEVTRDVSLYEFGIIVDVVADEREREILERDIAIAIDRKELRPEDAAVVRSIKNLKLANQYMLNRRKAYMQEQMQMAAEQSRQNAEAQAQAAQQSAQNEIQKESVLSNLRMKEKEHEFNIFIRQSQIEHNNKMEEISLQNEGKKEVAQINDQEMKK